MKLWVLVPLLLGSTAFGTENQNPPILEVQGGRILKVDLTTNPPQTVLSNLRTALKQRQEKPEVKSAERELDILTHGLIHLAEHRYEQAAEQLRMVPTGHLLEDAALFYRAVALRKMGENLKGKSSQAAKVHLCRNARKTLANLLDFQSSPIARKRTEEYALATLCYTEGLIALQHWTEAKNPLISLLLSNQAISDLAHPMLLAGWIRILIHEHKTDEAALILKKSLAAYPKNTSLRQLAQKLPTNPAPIKKMELAHPTPSTPRTRAQPEVLEWREANRHFQKGRLKNALDHLLVIHSKYPGSLTAQKSEKRLQEVVLELLNKSSQQSYFVGKLKKLPPDTLYRLGRFIWNQDHDDTAYLFFEHLAHAYPHESFAGNVYYYLGRISEDRRNYRTARDWFEKLVLGHNANDFFEQAHFKMGWLSYLLKEDEKALAWLEYDRALHFDEPEEARGLYWTSKVLDRQGHTQKAQQVRQRIEQVAPLSYYAVLTNQLGQPSELPAVTEPKTSFLNAFRLQRARGFFAVGLSTVGTEILMNLKLEKDPASAWEAATLLSQVGAHLPAIRIADVLAKPHYGEPIPRSLLDLIFPAAFEDLIRQEAVERKLDPLLVIALVKQESAFDPKAQSRAGAMGLMQLMPATASLVAQKSQTQPPKGADLQLPAVNIRLGSNYLAGLLAENEGSLIHALATYNAGPTRTLRWKERWGEMAPEEFVEMIPFEETRTYVKTIIRNYAYYAFLLEKRQVRFEEIVRFSFE